MSQSTQNNLAVSRCLSIFGALCLLVGLTGCKKEQPPRPQIAEVLRLLEDEELPWKTALWREFEVLRLGELDIVIRYRSGHETRDYSGDCYLHESKITEPNERLKIYPKARQRWEQLQAVNIKVIEQRAIKERMAELKRELKELETKGGY